MLDINATGHAIARGVAPEDCWAVISDHRGWQDWASVIHESILVAPGVREEGGLGAKRKFLDEKGSGFLEIINIFDAPRLFGYHICEEAVLSNHQGVIAFNSVEDGTEILWSMSATNNGYILAEGNGQSLNDIMQHVMDLTLADLVAACEARA